MLKNENKKPSGYNVAGVLLVIVFAAVCYLVFGLLLSAAVAYLGIWEESGFLSVLGNYLAANTAQILLFLSVLFASNAILHTTLRSLSSDRPFRYSYFLLAAAVSFVIMALFSLFFHDGISFNAASLSDRLLFLPIVLVITPVQCIAEELFFRVLPARLVLNKDLSKADLFEMLMISVFSGFIFLVPHMGGTEFTITSSTFALCFYYVAYGFLAMFISIYTRGFELSFGIHTAINLYSVLFVSYSASALKGFPLFIKEGMPSLVTADIQMVLIFIAVLLLVTRSARTGFKGQEGPDGTETA